MTHASSPRTACEPPVGTPWETKAVILSSKDRKGFGLPKYVTSDRPPKRHPWAMELANGQRCFFIQGAGQVTVGGMRVNYECKVGNVVGVPRRGSVWNALYLEPQSTETDETDVTAVWF
jgi:hypothetical protein